MTLAPRPIRRSRFPAAAVVVGLVAAGAIVPAPRLRDAATLAPFDRGDLVLPPSYVLLAPFCGVLDTLTLLNVRQHIALLGSLVALYVVWRLIRGGGSDARSAVRRIGREAVLAGSALGVLVAVYAVGALVPRPMARLRVADRHALAVDFHAHTAASHDGRRGYTAAAVRRWHGAAGFDAVYVSDHATFAGVRPALTMNPRRAGDGPVVLSAIEHIWRGQHVNVLGDTGAFMRAMAQTPAPQPPAPMEPRAVVVLTIPGDLGRVPAADSQYAVGVDAIELSDGAPRGLDQIQRDRSRILHLADSLRLAIVAGSDNHGWGYTAAAWTLLVVPGWRAVSADSLDLLIRRLIHARGRDAARVVERHGPDIGGSRLAAAFTLPAVAWQIARELTPVERASWVAWTVVLLLGASAADRWRR